MSGTARGRRGRAPTGPGGLFEALAALDALPARRLRSVPPPEPDSPGPEPASGDGAGALGDLEDLLGVPLREPDGTLTAEGLALRPAARAVLAAAARFFAEADELADRRSRCPCPCPCPCPPA